MAGLPFYAITFKELWETWNIRVLIILSFLLQSFLILFAPLRRPIGDKWLFRIPLWIAYLLADWIAIYVIGLIVCAERSGSHDILVFWAPFLLLHLGGPDTITSFALEDNEFWIRHLLQLILQVGSTVYVIIQSLPHNKLLLPTLLVLTAGIIKYAERNRAFYVACLDHYGEACCSVTEIILDNIGLREIAQVLLEFSIAPYDIIRNLLVGPLISPRKREHCRSFYCNETPEAVLAVMEFELSLLYEVLHTKLPVVNSKIGYIRRIINMGFIYGAMLSFRSITKAKQYHDDLENSEVWVTYGLLIGAITLDFISIWFLISSDYYFVAHKCSSTDINNDNIMQQIHHRVKNRRMWSKRIPQLNFITYCVKASPDWLNKLAECLKASPDWLINLAERLPIGFILEFIPGFRSMSSQVFEEQVLWNLIFEQVKGKAESAETVEMGKEICLRRGDGILDSHSNKNLIWSVKNLDYVESLLTWHIATELCSLHEVNQRPSSRANPSTSASENPSTSASENPSTSSSENPDLNYQKRTKLLSDYMFYLLHEETVIRAEADWKDVFYNTFQHMQHVYLQQGKEDVSKRMISTNPGSKPPPYFRRSVLCKAHKLFNYLKPKGSDQGIPWKLMSEVWVELMCYAAINCRPNVHAQQPSKGGQLITIVWLLMNHFGLGTQFEADKGAVDDDEETSVDDDKETSVDDDKETSVDDDEETNVLI